jgi:predicted TIM-barrel fold metal-dependent hydrolase
MAATRSESLYQEELDMVTAPWIRQIVDATPMVDTHEHLWEEARRISALDKHGEGGVPAPDFGMLFAHYVDSDLLVSGMPHESVGKLTRHDLDPKAKWALIEPYYERIRLTGYGRCVRESVRCLFGEDDLRADNAEQISQKLREGVRPGFYRHVLQGISNVEYAMVNSLETPVFRETAQPDLLCQDISTVALSSGLNIKAVTEALDREAKDLAGWHGIIDECFERFGPRAIAVKNQSAYARRLDYAQVSTEDAAPLFARYLKEAGSLDPAELKALQDHLFHYTVRKATEHKLPVKLHTGYYAGSGGMPLERVRQNAGDVCALLQAHRDARFDFFHIDYPYQDEIIALAKHYPNAWVDMCWTWIINPAASVRFLKEFLTAAPANKVLGFGGDMLPLELVPGHAAIARQGIAQALSELLEEGWIKETEVQPTAERILRQNAHELFDYPRTLAAWKK